MGDQKRDFEDWSSPDYMEFPCGIRSLETTADGVFAHLVDGRTVNVTPLVNKGTEH